MRVLVTGGGGYLGCHVTALLIERGHTVRVFDRFCFGGDAARTLAGFPGCEVVQGDIRRLQETPDLLDGVDAIVHMAGIANDPSCDLAPEMAVDVNQESTRELAEQAIHRDIRRFVFVSSCSVYGKGVFDLLDEQSPTNPVSTYGTTKLAGEETVLRMASDHFDPVVARPGTLYGWSDRMRFDLAVNQMAATALRNGAINVYGGGGQWRPFLHVRDAADALIRLVDAPADTVRGETFNIGHNDANYRIIDLAQQLAGQFGVDIEVVKSDEDQRTHRVVFDKFTDTFGFKPERSVEDGAREVRHALEESGIDPFNAMYFNVRRLKELLATPVDEGGEPVAAHFIPLARPSLSEEEERAVVETLRSGWLTTGARTQTFEKSLATAVGAPETVAVTSCTAALHLCLVQMGVRPGDEVITSPLTWPSTANTIVNMGAKPVLADIDPDTLNIDPVAIGAAITNRTKAIMPVHLAGLPCNLEAVYALAKRHGIGVLEDAAHALGARYQGVPIGGYGEYACFSFYPIKNITTIDGGAVAVKDPDKAAHLRELANNGMSAIAWHRYGRSAAAAPPQVVEPGFKYRMHDVSAALGIEQLKKLDGFIAARARLAKMYRTVLADIDEVALPAVPDTVDHAWHLLIIRLKLDRLTATRDEIAQALRRENVGTGVHFLGIHLHKYYAEALGMRPEDLPHATAASDSILSLPLHPSMTDKNVREAVDALKKVIAHHLK
ncbi:MAG: aminotransferase class I/II-fold pyridoxal phosphate-dependent enzyme [bacterium]|nr:aminotransferase class I/II-fold pyridoxal phosphate-dependent enzyme [bacterium]